MPSPSLLLFPRLGRALPFFLVEACLFFCRPVLPSTKPIPALLQLRIKPTALTSLSSRATSSAAEIVASDGSASKATAEFRVARAMELSPGIGVGITGIPSCFSLSSSSCGIRHCPPGVVSAAIAPPLQSARIVDCGTPSSRAALPVEKKYEAIPKTYTEQYGFSTVSSFFDMESAGFHGLGHVSDHR